MRQWLKSLFVECFVLKAFRRDPVESICVSVTRQTVLLLSVWKCRTCQSVTNVPIVQGWAGGAGN